MCINILRDGIALTLTDVRIPYISLWMLKVKWFALFTVASHCVMLAIIAHSTTGISGCHIYSHIKMALDRVFIAIAL